MTPFTQEILCKLAENHVEFVVVSGVSAILNGVEYTTVDVNICFRRTPDNIRRLAQALAPFHPRLRDFPPDLPFTFDERALQFGTNFTLDLGGQPVDLLGDMSGVGGYDQAIQDARRVTLGGFVINVLSLNHLIACKLAAGRRKDLALVPHLEAAAQLQQQRNKPSDDR